MPIRKMNGPRKRELDELKRRVWGIARDVHNLPDERGPGTAFFGAELVGTGIRMLRYCGLSNREIRELVAQVNP